MHGRASFFLAVGLAASVACAQAESEAEPVRAQPQVSSEAPETPGDPAEAAEQLWSFSLSVTGYIYPDDEVYLQPTFTADHDWLHLEIRYNYEDLNTTSAWFGYNLSVGTEFTVDFTPMIGAVAGDTEGVAPGYELTLGYHGFELYTEGEYIFDFGDSSESFFYSWTEVSYSPVDTFRFGIALQHTKTRDSGLEADHGLLAGFTFGSVDVAACVMDLGQDKPGLMLSVELEF